MIDVSPPRHAKNQTVPTNLALRIDPALWSLEPNSMEKETRPAGCHQARLLSYSILLFRHLHPTGLTFPLFLT